MTVTEKGEVCPWHPVPTVLWTLEAGPLERVTQASLDAGVASVLGQGCCCWHGI